MVRLALTTKTANGRARLAIFIPSAIIVLVGLVSVITGASYVGAVLLTAFGLIPLAGFYLGAIWLRLWIRGEARPLDS